MFLSPFHTFGSLATSHDSISYHFPLSQDCHLALWLSFYVDTILRGTVMRYKICVSSLALCFERKVLAFYRIPSTENVPSSTVPLCPVQSWVHTRTCFLGFRVRLWWWRLWKRLTFTVALNMCDRYKQTNEETFDIFVFSFYVRRQAEKSSDFLSCLVYESDFTFSYLCYRCRTGIVLLLLLCTGWKQCAHYSRDNVLYFSFFLSLPFSKCRD